jgi:signal transduction histidine kinase
MGTLIAEVMASLRFRRGARSRWRAILLPSALVLVLGVLDYMTGREIMISPLYLGPICWATWRAGRRTGLILAVAGAATWLVADLMTHYAYAHPAVPYWNAVMLWVFYGVVVYLLSAFHDAHRHLEAKVERRTAALQAEIAGRKRLEAARIQSERLAAMGMMAAEVAHEVRNPLSSIVLNLDLLQQEVGKLAAGGRHPADEGRLLVEEVRAEVCRIQRVLADYLQFARKSASKREPVCLNNLLKQKLAFMQGDFERAGVKLRTTYDPSLKPVEGDGEQLWQAMLNLVRNSLEAMPDGGELAVSTRRDETHAVMQICDNGQGMAAAQLQQVFTPFFTTKAAGTGLGLSLVQQIVTEHRGHVECVSAPDQGSTFAVLIPLTP